MHFQETTCTNVQTYAHAHGHADGQTPTNYISFSLLEKAGKMSILWILFQYFKSRVSNEMLPSILCTAAMVEVATANGSGGDAFTQKYFI